MGGGADPNIPDGAGVTPLGHARAKGYGGMAEILRSAAHGNNQPLGRVPKFGALRLVGRR